MTAKVPSRENGSANAGMTVAEPLWTAQEALKD